MIEENCTAGKITKMQDYFKTSKYFVAKLQDKIVGVVSAGIDCVIRTLWILPKCQSQFVGFKLLTQALNYLKNINEILDCTGFQQEGRAIKFYEKFGFIKTVKETLLWLCLGQTKRN